MNGQTGLWLRIATGPLVWFISLEADFALAPLAPGIKTVLILISVVCLIITAAGAYSGWVQWRDWKTGEQAAQPGQRVLAFGGAMLCALSFLVILAQAVPSFAS
jgi:hypothetical protein